MKVSVICFSTRGHDVARRVRRALVARDFTVAVERAFGEARTDPAEWCASAWEEFDALVFVSPAQMALQLAAPRVAAGGEAPAVACVDEAVRVCVPLLAGRSGAADALARDLAAALGCEAAVTSPAVDAARFDVGAWAASCGLRASDPQAVGSLTERLRESGPVVMAFEQAPEGEAPDGVVAAAASQVGAHAYVGVRTATAPVRLVPHVAVLGVGCRKGAPAVDLVRAAGAFMRECGIDPRAVTAVACIDERAGEPGLRALARSLGASLLSYSAAELDELEGDFDESDAVRGQLGVGNVCERAVVAAGAELAVRRTSTPRATFALGTRPWGVKFPPKERLLPQPGSVCVVGLGAAGAQGVTRQALSVLRRADVICGAGPDLELVRSLVGDRELLPARMANLADRCRVALGEASRGRAAVFVCAGDAGVRGVARQMRSLAGPGVDVDAVCGIPLHVRAAAAAGTPIPGDHAVVSLAADDTAHARAVADRVRLLAEADLDLCLVDVANRNRPDQLRRACDALLEALPPEAPCAVVRTVGAETTVRRLPLEKLRTADVDRFCTVFVGSATAPQGL